MLCMDNGPEYISQSLAEWPHKDTVKQGAGAIRPIKPTENVFIESFNRTDRTEILDFYLFSTQKGI